MIQESDTENGLPVLTRGTYRHSKSGNHYEVVDVALYTESDQAVVIYKPLYITEDGIMLFVRPYDMFVENVELDGRQVPRFEKIED